MRRAGWCLALVLCFAPLLPAEDGPAPEAEASASTTAGAPAAPFPLAPLVQASRLRELHWRPDWPLALPPDAFTARPRRGGGLPASITVTTGEAAYVLRRDSAGFLRAFPWMIGGELLNVSLTGGSGFGAGTGESETLWTAEFLEFSAEDTALPVLCRLSSGGAWFFVRLEYRGRYTGETWFDADGAALGHFEHTWSAAFPAAPSGPEDPPRLVQTLWADFSAEPALPAAASASSASVRAPPPAGPARPSASTAGETAPPVPSSAPGIPPVIDYYYDSFGNLCGITATSRAGAALADYTARWQDARPRYWDRPAALSVTLPVPAGEPAPSPESAGNGGTASPQELPGTFRFQWDERGFPVAFSGVAGPSGGEGGAAFDSRYEYAVDGDGNWTARRETVLIRRQGYLVQTAVRNITRRIDWRAGE